MQAKILLEADYEVDFSPGSFVLYSKQFITLPKIIVEIFIILWYIYNYIDELKGRFCFWRKHKDETLLNVYT